jgi:hypothetical protein
VRKPSAILVGVVALLTAATLSGCSGAQPSQALTDPTSSPVVSAGAKPSPTQAPTPSPTAAPTATPTATPVPSPSAALIQWQQFASHSQRADDRLTKLLTEMYASKSFSTDKAVARKLRSWSKSEKTWLNAHPAHACYTPTFVEYRRGVSDYDKAALTLIQGQQSLRTSLIDKGYKLLDTAEGHLSKAATSKPVSEAACAAVL